MDLTGQELQQLGQQMFGQNWRKLLAEQIGLSYARVSQLSNADKVPTKSAAKIEALHAQWKANGSVTPGIVQIGQVTKDEDADLSDAQIIDRINKRFSIMDRMVDGMLKGVIRSLIVSGAPGIGKTYGLELKIKKAHKEDHLDYTILRGTCSAPGLYQALYNARDGGIVVIDDCDSIFNDEQAFNILKAALDSTNERTIAWRKQSAWVYDVNHDEPREGDDRFPNEFDFEGAVVFVTNLNFRHMQEKGTKLSPHFGALLSRSMYLDLTLHSMRSRVLRIKDVFLGSMRKTLNLTAEQGEEILKYVLDNADRVCELSLRTMKHIADLYQLGPDWKEVVEYTKMKYPKFD
jgi:hypothetical protein